MLAFWCSPYGFQSSFAEMTFKKIIFPHRNKTTLLDLANSSVDGDSPVDSTDSDLDSPTHKHMDRDANLDEG